MIEIFGVPSQALFGQLLIGLINGSFYAERSGMNGACVRSIPEGFTYLTNSQPPSLMGRKAWSAGIVAFSL